MPVRKPTLMLLALLCSGAQAQAGALTEALAQARRHDPVYQQAVAERDVNRNSADQAGTAYYPTFQASYTQLETESSTRRTYTLTQPLVSADRFATWRESEPRELLATATFEQREQDLSQRLLKALSELLRAHEGLRLNRAKIEALQTQQESAKRALALGQGTVTDERDALVRLEQARADTLVLEAQIDAAQRQISAMTGQPAQALLQDVPRAQRALALQPLERYVEAGLQSNPPLRVARHNQQLAEINVQRADWVLLPTVAAVVMRSESSGVQNNYAGVSVSLPLQAGSYYQMRGAAASASKSQEAARDAEQRTRLEVQRLWSLVRAGLAEIEIRLKAIEAAQLSVEANEKSFRGGVRSQIDRLNSIQTLYQVQQDYVNAVLTLADNYLNLLLQSGTAVDTAVAQVQTVLFPTP